MPSWQDELLSALQVRDTHEKANEEFYTNYSKLADRAASLQNAANAQQAASPAPSPKPQANKVSQSSKQASLPAPSNDELYKLRQDLTEAQRSRRVLETKLQSVTEELQGFKIQSSLGSKRISDLTKERDQLSRSVKDRDEEIKGKAKLLENLHDETVSLTLQLNMADEKAAKLGNENKELVERWMRRMGEEADQMNEKSRFS